MVYHLYQLLFSTIYYVLKMSMKYLQQYCVRQHPVIRCKTKTSIIHNRLEQFFARHVKYDYSDDRYTYIVTRIKHADSDTEYMEITYTQFSSIYECPTKEITITRPTTMICIIMILTII